MKKYFLLTLLFLIIMNGCAMQNQIDFSSSEAFFSSLNKSEIIQKENKKELNETKKYMSKLIYNWILKNLKEF